MRTTILAGGLLMAALALPSAADAAYTAKVQAGTLKLAGDGASDAVRLDPNGAALVVDVGADGTIDFTFDKATFTAVNVTAGGGDDQVTLGSAAANDKLVTVDGGAGNDTITGGAGPETLIGGAGDDVIDGNLGADVVMLGAGNDRFNWDPGDSSDTVEGGSGSDVLDFNGANVSELYDISANGARVRLTRNVASIVMDLDDTERIALRTLGGADTVTVSSLAGTDIKAVDVNQAALDGTGDAQIDNVIVNGTAGDDKAKASAIAGGVAITGLGTTVNVTGSETDRDLVTVAGLAGADTFATGIGIPDGPFATVFDGGEGTDKATYTGTAGEDTINASANGTLAYAGATGHVALETTTTVESLVLTGGNGNDTFNAAGNLAPLATITMDGGAGDDTIRGGNGADLLLGGNGNDTIDGNQGNDTALLGSGADHFSWDPGDGNDTIEGQAGSDTLDFNGSAVSELMEVSANGGRVRLTRNIGNITTDLDEIETVALRALGGADTITVNPLGGTSVKDVRVDEAADAQSDDVIVAGSAGADEFRAAPAADGVAVTGTGTRVTVTGSPADGDHVTVAGLEGEDVTLYNGTPSDDTIAVTANGLFPHVSTGGGIGLQTATVERLNVQAGNGADTIAAAGNLAPLATITMDGGAGDDTIRGGNGNDLLLGGNGNDTIDGNQGNDTALLGSGADHFTWDPGDGNDTIEGQAGSDTLDFNGSNIGELLEVGAGGGRVRFTRNIGNVVMDLDDVEGLALRPLGGADQFTVGDLTGTDLKTADVNLAGSNGLGDEQPDTVIANGTAAKDAVKVTRADAQVVAKGLFAQTRITGSEPALDVFRIHTLAGDDTVTVAPDVSMLIATLVDLGADG